MIRIRYLEFKHQLFSNPLLGDKDLFNVTVDLDKQKYFIYNSKKRCVAQGMGSNRADLLRQVRSELKSVGVQLDDPIVQRKKKR